MVVDGLALGRYTQAKEKMDRACRQRRNLAKNLETWASYVTTGHDIVGTTVKRLDIAEAQEILQKMSKLEDEIAAALVTINANATKCGKQTMMFSVVW